MPASRGLPVPLVIVCLVLIRGYSPLPTTSGIAVTDPKRHPVPRGFSAGDPVLSTEDYGVFDDPTLPPITRDTQPPLRRPRCDYNPCLEFHISCYELSLTNNCSCPGHTLQNEPPQAPVMRSVSWNGSEVVIHWCAPFSVVTDYIVTVGGKERQRFGKDQRRGGVGDIDDVSQVCVAALNDAGKSEAACEMYQPKDHSLPLKAGLIGGALGFLLLLLLAVLLWRHKRQRKQQASISMRHTAETQ